MSSFAGIGKRAPASTRFWRNNAFWLVVLPTTLVAVPFVLAMIARALEH
jgi:hypothetical protein